MMMCARAGSAENSAKEAAERAAKRGERKSWCITQCRLDETAQRSQPRRPVVGDIRQRTTS
jgi:hypothetical protein